MFLHVLCNHQYSPQLSCCIQSCPTNSTGDCYVMHNETLGQGWANFFYRGPHWKFYCCRRAAYIFCLLKLRLQHTKIWINDNNHVFCQLNLHTIWPQNSIKINETNVTVVIDPGAIKTWFNIGRFEPNTRNKTSKNLANMYVPTGCIIYSGRPHAARGP